MFANSLSWILAILALGVLIVVHEAGHYLVARWCKMRVERFSVGFGPAVASWKRNGTIFQLAPIPLGGFVQITGMNPHEEFDERDPHVFPNRPIWQRFLTIFAGPATNVLFASVLVFTLLATSGGEMVAVGNVAPGSAAQGALLPGDVIVQIDGKPFYGGPSALPARVQAANGEAMQLTVRRAGKDTVVSVTPRWEAKDGAWRLGVVPQLHKERQDVPLGVAVVESLRYPIVKSELILGGLWDIVTRKAPPDAIGPVGMTQMISGEIRAGWVRALELLAILNVYLGLFNLLPLPALDGGRLAFLLYEMTTRRRPNPKVEAAVHMAGFLILFVVMILVTFKDIKRLFT